MAVLLLVVVAAAVVLRHPYHHRHRLRAACTDDADHQQHLYDAVVAQIRRKDVASAARLLGPYVLASSSSSPPSSDAARRQQYQLLASALHLTLGKTRARRAAQAALLLGAAADAGADTHVLHACRHALHVLDPVAFAPVPPLPVPLTTTTTGLFWDALADVHTESQQRPHWHAAAAARAPLDVVTSLAAVDAVVRDAPLLLAARPPTEPAPAASLYATALGAVPHGGRGGLVGPPLDAFLARACVSDPRLQRAVQLTQHNNDDDDGCLLPLLLGGGSCDVLTVGDGDLSFSAALGTATPVTIAVTAPTVEPPEALDAKYAAAHAHVAAVAAGGGRVL
jgi:hypothetical protein